jgi:hypothetical protein
MSQLQPEHDISRALAIVKAAILQDRQLDAFEAHLAYLDGIIADPKQLDANLPTGRAGNADDTSSRPRAAPASDPCDLREWRRADRAAWAEYRKWEDKRFPTDPAKPFKDPPGMAAARRAFERTREISKAKEILRLREASRVR